MRSLAEGGLCDIVVERRYDLAINDRQAIGRKILPYASTLPAYAIEEAIEMAHSAGRKIVQHHEAPR